MKTDFLKSALCAGALAVAAAPALAAPLQRSDVPAEPAWVLHLDCDALRPTAIGQYVLSQMDKPEAKAGLAALQMILAFDPRKQLHGLTLYSIGKVPEDGVLLVYADVEPDRLITLAKAAKDAQSTTYKKNVIYNWIDDKKKAKQGVKRRVYAAVHGKHLVVFSQQEVRVAQALDVLNRASPNLATSGVFPQLGASGTGIIIQGAARKLDLPDSTPNAALFRLAKLARLQVAEAQGRVQGTLTLDANDEEVADQMLTVGKGLVALMKLQKENASAIKLADSLALKQDGASVVATLAISSDEVIELMKADAARKAQEKAEEK